MATDITEPSFREKLAPIANQSIIDINVLEYDMNNLDFVTAYLLGIISSLQTQIPDNHLVVLFGESGCGKSYLIHIISELKKRDLTQITEKDREFFELDPKDYTSDGEIRELKDMVDEMTIVPKKTTRPSRDGKVDKPEIKEGLNRVEVEKCEWTYKFAGNLYGISKEEIDEALKRGDAIVIVNDESMQVTLKEAYPRNFLPMMVYQDFDKQKWINDMRKAGRTEEEIERRLRLLGVSQRIYTKNNLPGVVFNMSEARTVRNLLRQLKGQICMEDEHNRGRSR